MQGEFSYRRWSGSKVNSCLKILNIAYQMFPFKGTIIICLKVYTLSAEIKIQRKFQQRGMKSLEIIMEGGGGGVYRSLLLTNSATVIVLLVFSYVI